MLRTYFLLHRNEIQLFIEKQKIPINQSATIHIKGGVRNSAQKVDKYFSGLSLKQVKALTRMYKYDFLLFGYSNQHFLDLLNLTS